MFVVELLLNLIEKYNYKSTKYLVLFPFLSFGNRAEDILFAILKVKRENKKLILLCNFRLFWKFSYRKANQELLKLENNYKLFQYNTLSNYFLMALFFSIFSIPRIINLLLYKLVGLPINPHIIDPHIGHCHLWSKPNQQFNLSSLKKMDWGRQLHNKLNISFNVNKENISQKILEKLGLPKKAWYVCLHVREGGFFDDQLESQSRNADISEYIDAIQFITKSGGYVIRIGDKSMKKLPNIERVIDYAHDKINNELLDLYIIKNCHFYMGMQSGPMDVAQLFQKPILLINMDSWAHCSWYRKDCLFFPKKVYSEEKEKYLTVDEVLNEIHAIGHIKGSIFSEKYKFKNNSSDEILMATVEMLEYLKSNNYTERQNVFKERYKESMLQAFEDYRYYEKDFDDNIQKYRWASRIISMEGNICDSALT